MNAWCGIDAPMISSLAIGDFRFVHDAGMRAHPQLYSVRPLRSLTPARLVLSLAPQVR